MTKGECSSRFIACNNKGMHVRNKARAVVFQAPGTHLRKFGQHNRPAAELPEERVCDAHHGEHGHVVRFIVRNVVVKLGSQLLDVESADGLAFTFAPHNTHLSMEPDNTLSTMR